MAEEVVSSFPFEEWASEVRNALIGAGIDAEVGYEGPRAWPVFIKEDDSEKAQEILSQVGYLSCAASPSTSMSGVLDWFPVEGSDLDDIRGELESAVEQIAVARANESAAMSWSFPNEEEDADRVVVIARFGDAVATNGDPGLARIPLGYVNSGRGGRVSGTSEIVDLNLIFEDIKELDEFSKYPPMLIEEILKEIRDKKYDGRQDTYISVSGETEFYEPEKEDAES